MKPSVTELLEELGKHVQGVGRNIASKKGHDVEGFNHLIETLRLDAETLEICRDLEYEYE